MLLAILSIFFIVFICLVHVKKDLSVDEDEISRQTTICLKGIFGLFVVLIHITYVSDFFFQHEYLGMLFWILGPLCVCGFYFLSGYGVMLSYNKGGLKYIKKLIVKKIPLLYLFVILSNIIYLIEYRIGGINLSFSSSLKSVLHLSFLDGYIELNSYDYFILDLIRFYIGISAIAIILDKVRTYKITKRVGSEIKDYCNYEEWFCLIICIIFSVFLIILFITNNSFGATAAFPTGCVAFIYCQKIKRFSPKKIIIINLGLFFMLIIGIIFIYCLPENLWGYEFVRKEFVPLIFCMLLLINFNNFTYKNRILIFLGKINLIVYLTHRIFIYLFAELEVRYKDHWEYIYILRIENENFRTFIILICIFIFSTFIYLIKNYIIKYILFFPNLLKTLNNESDFYEKNVNSNCWDKHDSNINAK